MFYVIEITKKTDSNKTEKAIYEYETQLDAVGSFHKKLGGAMQNDTFASELVTVIDERGATLAHDYFVRKIEATEETSEE